MSGEWVKMRTNLWDDPRVARLCDATDASEGAVIGGLYWLWASADDHSEDGCMPGLSLTRLDRKTGVPGLGAALVAIGWIEDTEGGLTIIRFSEHNGNSAKKRAVDAKRASRHRHAPTVTESGESSGNVGNDRHLEEEEEEERTTSPDGDVSPAKADRPSKGDAPPACPHEKIIAAFHTALPASPRVLEWTDTRRKHLQTRWREKPKRQSIEWWERLFAYASQSKFLTGQSQSRDGRDPFVVTLDWLIKPENLAKLIEGKYHGEDA